MTKQCSHIDQLSDVDPRTDAVLAFFESAYQAGAALAGWEVAVLRSTFAPVLPARS